MASQTLENYLKAMYYLSLRSDVINTTDIAQAIQVSLPTVNSMVKKMAELGYLKYKRYKPVVFTKKGKTAAALIIRKHRLTEMFLVEKMFFGWEEVHDVAEQLEHIDSPLFFSRIDEMLGYPKFDPHGSPIPDKKGNIPTISFKRLSEFNKGDQVTLKALQDTSDEFLKYLNSKNLRLGSQIKIQDIENFDKSMKVLLEDKSSLMITQSISQKLLVDY